MRAAIAREADDAAAAAREQPANEGAAAREGDRRLRRAARTRAWFERATRFDERCARARRRALASAAQEPGEDDVAVCADEAAWAPPEEGDDLFGGREATETAPEDDPNTPHVRIRVAS